MTLKKGKFLDNSWTKENLHTFQRKLIYVKDWEHSAYVTDPVLRNDDILRIRFQSSSLAAIGFVATCERSIVFGAPGAWGIVDRHLSNISEGVLVVTTRTSWGGGNFAKDPVFVLPFTKSNQQLVIVGGFSSQGGLWIDARYHRIRSHQSLQEIGSELCGMWEGHIGPDRVKILLSEEHVTLSISLKRRMVAAKLQQSVNMVVDSPRLVAIPGVRAP